MPRVVALSGGVGGAKLVSGLADILPTSDLTVVVNTGDDFTHWGFHIAPDIDTVMYTLSGLSHPVQGWGVAGDTFTALAMVERYGGESWFRLGDRDLGTHIVRAQALASGKTLTEVTESLCRALGVAPRLLPMSDGPRRTMFDTVEHGPLSFQEYFVKHGFRPTVRRVRFDGDPPPSPAAIEAIAAADFVVICPSNPYVSVDPIITLPGMREALVKKTVIAVSPIVGGKALKGAAAKLMVELGDGEPSAAGVARHYGDLLTAFVVEHGDAVEIPGLRVHATNTVMVTQADRRSLAADVIAVAGASA
ncbi:MAG TPA: 2-phospho-L-lactate transferase [Polyangiaceae bacterium]|nr:2-phospho-L-lactate transferase [Polyangiaceae bacterium]